MSGGSYNYFFLRIETFASDIRNAETDPVRKAFRDHLRLVARAAKAIEWVDSCDMSPGYEHEFIRGVIGEDTGGV